MDWMYLFSVLRFIWLKSRVSLIVQIKSLSSSVRIVHYSLSEKGTSSLGPEGSVHPGLKVMFAQGQKSPSVVSASDPEGNVQAKPKVRNLISLRAGEVRRALWSKSPRSPLTEWSEKLSSKSIQTKHLRFCLFWFGLARPPGRFYCFFVKHRRNYNCHNL